MGHKTKAPSPSTQMLAPRIGPNDHSWHHFFLNSPPVSNDFLSTRSWLSHGDLIPVSPGEMLEEEFLKPLRLSIYRLAKDIGVPSQQISDIVLGKHGITADMDLRLCKYFGLSDGWWLHGQASYDSAHMKQAIAKDLDRITPCKRLAFSEDNFTHEQVFGHLKDSTLSVTEAAEYLEVSVSTLRRYVQSGKLHPTRLVGRNQLFNAQDLRAFKRKH